MESISSNARPQNSREDATKRLFKSIYEQVTALFFRFFQMAAVFSPVSGGFTLEIGLWNIFLLFFGSISFSTIFSFHQYYITQFSQVQILLLRKLISAIDS